ncbi:MAG: prephenate dehydrogenase [Clostridia bacterium]|nr:prephenate dehydrogenase [Clostridia bacterium]
MIDKDTRILIVGLGVIGGSYAIALSREGYHVSCITKEPEDVRYALARGMIEEGSTDPDPTLIANADIIVFALYPATFVEWVRENGHLIKETTLVTDVSGVKSGVVYTVQELLGDRVEFISAHPMAGRERSGVEFADPEVFRGANYIVTPTERNTPEAIQTCKELGRILGFAKISELSVEEHDRMIGFLSQLTHVIAVTLMTSNDTPGLEKYTGDSFRDLTRIAKINDAMWSELFISNKAALLAEMDRFIGEFSAFRDMLRASDREGMREKMRESTARRTLFDKPKIG